MEQKTDIVLLVRKYDELIESLGLQLEEAKRKRRVLADALDLLEKEGILEQKLFVPPPIPLSSKYQKMPMNMAIKDAINTSSKGDLSGEEIHNELVKHGYQSSSQNLKRDIYTRLYRMEKHGILVSSKESGVKRYSLARIVEGDNSM